MITPMLNGGLVLRALVLLMLVGGVLIAGCGGSSETTTSGSSTGAAATTTEDGEGEEESTPEAALAEIATIRALLDQAVTQYESGDQLGAAEAVGDIYLDHFEQVEEPLGDEDHDLMEEIEEQLSTELRNEMEEGAPVSEIEAIVAEIDSELDEAVEALS